MVDETQHDKNGEPDWGALQNVWQDTPPVDMAKLARNARFVWWRMRLNFALEIVFSVAGFYIFARLIDLSSLSASLFGVVGMVFCIAGFWAAVHIRRGVWGEASEDALGLVRLQLKRARSEILYVRINYWLAYASIILLLLALWFLYDRIDTIEHRKIIAVSWLFAFVLAVIILFPLVTRRFIRRKKALIEKLRRVEAELEQEQEQEEGGL